MESALRPAAWGRALPRLCILLASAVHPRGRRGMCDAVAVSGPGWCGVVLPVAQGEVAVVRDVAQLSIPADLGVFSSVVAPLTLFPKLANALALAPMFPSDAGPHLENVTSNPRTTLRGIGILDVHEHDVHAEKRRQIRAGFMQARRS